MLPMLPMVPSSHVTMVTIVPIPRFIPVRILPGTILSSHSSFELREEIPPKDHGQQRGTAQHLIVHGAETDLLGQQVEEVHGPEVWHLTKKKSRGRPRHEEYPISYYPLVI